MAREYVLPDFTTLRRGYARIPGAAAAAAAAAAAQQQGAAAEEQVQMCMKTKLEKHIHFQRKNDLPLI